jgi:hypothetical protein
MPSARFLVAEFPGGGMVFARFTGEHPGTTVDMLSDSVEGAAGHKYHGTVFLVKGIGAEDVAALASELTRVYEPPLTLDYDPDGRQWLGRVRMRESAIPSAGGRGIAQFLHLVGVPWLHIEAGIVYMRARLPDGADADSIMTLIQGHLAEQGVEVHLDVEEVPVGDFGVWDDLVATSVGLRT